jgi:hypothetical protein
VLLWEHKLGARSARVIFDEIAEKRMDGLVEFFHALETPRVRHEVLFDA